MTTTTTWPNPELSAPPGAKHEHGDRTEFHGDAELTRLFEFPGKRASRRAVAEKGVETRKLALDAFRCQLKISGLLSHRQIRPVDMDMSKSTSNRKSNAAMREMVTCARETEAETKVKFMVDALREDMLGYTSSLPDSC